jgi:hypothetical protein
MSMKASLPEATPGPWTARGFHVYGAGVKIAESSSAVSVPVSTTAREQAIANARLIAAAPDLLATCKALREAVCGAMRVIADLDTGLLLGASAETRQQRFVDEMHRLGIADGFGVRADAVIAKAEGR